MFKVNRRKGQKGFTLVEVIVVAVIVAALAAVAVPLYLGYVDSSRKNAAANAAGSVASFCGACANVGKTLTPLSGVVTTGAVTCDNGTTIQIPEDVKIELVDNVAAAGNAPASQRGVKAIHKSSKDIAANYVTYNY